MASRSPTARFSAAAGPLANARGSVRGHDRKGVVLREGTRPGAAGEFDSRRYLVSAGLAARKLDALLVAFSPNLRYLTGFTGSNGCLLASRERRSCSPIPATGYRRPRKPPRS